MWKWERKKKEKRRGRKDFEDGTKVKMGLKFWYLNTLTHTHKKKK